MEYYRDNRYLVWIEDYTVWYKNHDTNYALGYSVLNFNNIKNTFTDVKKFIKFEKNSIIYDGEEAIIKYKEKIREVKIKYLMNEVL